MNKLRRKLLSACCSVLLLLNFGAPALEELAALDVLNSEKRVTFEGHKCVGWGETAVIDNDKHNGAFLKESFTGVHVYCGTFQRVSSNENFIMLSIFLPLFYITPYLDSVLSAFIIQQCFKTE